SSDSGQHCSVEGNLSGSTDSRGQCHRSIPQAVSGVRKRKLVLHLDLNNTIVVSDTATNQGIRAALNCYLTTVTWGRINQEGDWQWLSDVPSLLPPCEGAVSYYSQFGRAVDFTDTKEGQRFKSVFTDRLKKMEWRGTADQVLSATGEDGKEYHWLLPAFFQLIQSLCSEGRDFAILFRTFGTDLPSVLRGVQYAMDGHHPQFQDLCALSLPLNLSPGQIRCNRREVVVMRETERISTHTDSQSIYCYFSSMQGIGGFQDHFDWWAHNHFTSKGGKPFWISPHDSSIQHIFIDDNIRLNDADTIVYPQVLESKNEEVCTRTVPTSELYNICLVQTDLLRAISDQNYFTECMHACEENYDKYLEVT
uniref:Si:dkey-32e6.3 n=2 Tax=Latimeria chalumnae TaxID=7897 RepID=H3AQ08_LATCH